MSRIVELVNKAITSKTASIEEVIELATIVMDKSEKEYKIDLLVQASRSCSTGMYR